MRPHVVEFFDEPIETDLLTSEGRSRRSRRFPLQSLVHSLVTPVLLRPPGLDQLGEDAQANPPDRESTQPADGGGSERCSIVGADDPWKTEGSENLCEHWFRSRVIGRIQRPAFE
jgi:hypothetical protein